MNEIKLFINKIANPQILFPMVFMAYLIIFPPTQKLMALHKRLGVDRLWTNLGGVLLMAGLTIFFLFGLTDPNFQKIVSKPDNVPIVILIFLSTFLLWLSMKQGRENDLRDARGLPPNEAVDAKEKVLVWPDLVFIELIALVLVAGLLILWAILLQAPIEEPANPAVSPNPSKAPWYFLGLQEMLVYFDPWLAGVLFPTVIMIGFMAIPYLDNNPKGAGYYTYQQRRLAINVFMFLWMVLWLFLITTGTFLRGPNWNFYGPFEYWDHHKLEALTNVNLSELIYMKWLNRSLPGNILLREMWGFLLVGGYFTITPLLLAVTFLKGIYQRLGVLRYSIFVMLTLIALSLPIKMILRWAFNIKYLVSIPEFFFNI